MGFVVHAVVFEFGTEGMQSKATEARNDTNKPEQRQVSGKPRKASAPQPTKESNASKATGNNAPAQKDGHKDAPIQQGAKKLLMRIRPSDTDSTSLARRTKGSTSLAKRPASDSTALAKRTRKSTPAKRRPAGAAKQAGGAKAPASSEKAKEAANSATKIKAADQTTKTPRATSAKPADTESKATPQKAAKPAASADNATKGTNGPKAAGDKATPKKAKPKGAKTAQKKAAKSGEAKGTGAKKKKGTKKAAPQKGASANGQKPASTKVAATTKQAQGAKKKAAATKANGANKPKAAHVKQPEKKTALEAIQDAFVSAKDWVVNNARSPKFIVPVVLVVLYIGISVYFSMHYLPGTVINEVDASWSTAKKVASKVQEAHTNYGLKVVGDGINLDISSADIDFSLDPQAYEKGAEKDLPGWLWPVAAFTPRRFNVTEGVLFDQDKLRKTTDATVDAYNKNATMPQDASISYDSSKKTFVATEEKGGNAISHDLANQAVMQGVQTLQSEVSLGEEQIQKPRITMGSNTIEGAIKQANTLGELEIPLMVKESKAATIEPELIRSWLALDEEGNVVADADLVADWAISTLAKKVNTVGTQRVYTRPSDGKRITIYDGTYGWEIDPQELTKKICAQLAAGSSDSLEIPMKSTAYKYIHNAQDWSPRYIDVDLSQQYVIMFDEDSNIIMQSECVTGNKSLNDETVTGVFYIESKTSPMKLIGLDLDGDGLPDYESDVQYWMPFYGGYGFHDALWRSYFGEDIYQYDGSHGCVNLPYYAAEILYNLVKVGDTVVVHE